MRKFLVLILLVISMSLVSAIPLANTDIRAQNGNLVFINEANNFENTKITFSAWATDNINGKGRLGISGKTDDGKRFNLVLKLVPVEVLENTGLELKVLNTGTGTYWEKGNKPEKINLDVIYTYKKYTKELSIESNLFEVEDMDIVKIK
ncbi:MAG: hypothetical protein PHE43_02195 [Candidatus Nanoarchaeia archaeon]|nr:hypothetical protein [Candidatus Nanoarchaeia archaeon]